MRNKVLGTIFHGPKRGDIGSGLPTLGITSAFAKPAAADPVPNPQNAVLGAISALVPPQGGTTGVTPGGVNAAADNQLTELFGTVSKNLDQLRSVTENQTIVLGANTEALTSNTAAKAASQVVSAAASTASNSLGGLTALPIISGLFSLFGGGSSSQKQQPLPKYNAPPKVDFNESLQPGTGGGNTQSMGFDQSGYSRIPVPEANVLPNYASLLGTAANLNPNGSNSIPSLPDSSSTNNQVNSPNSSTTNNHVTINVQAMDSRSFMDRSQDIAQAVREAMLNMHSINDVVNDL